MKRFKSVRYDFVVKELPALVEAHLSTKHAGCQGCQGWVLVEATLPVTDKRAISGHSMGGHGALTIGLKNPDMPLS